MTKKQEKKYAELTIEVHLDLIQEITGNHQDTLDLLARQPKDILFMRNDDLKYYLCVIQVCMKTVLLKKMEVKYSDKGFKVKLKTIK